MPLTRVPRVIAVLSTTMSFAILVAGCQPQGDNSTPKGGATTSNSGAGTDASGVTQTNPNSTNGPVQGVGNATRIVRVMSTSYDATNRIVTLKVQNDTRVNSSAVGSSVGATGSLHTQPQPSSEPLTGENVIDASTMSGIVNYATSRYPLKPVSWVRVVSLHGPQSHHKAPFMVPVNEAQNAPSGTQALAGFVGALQLPPGVTLDPNIVPIANISSSWAQKFDAIKSVAVSKLGTPYIWGHNEDRGQYGFDCSNFTAYVYHHALGYTMSDYSLVQATSVGYPIPLSQMRQGDLLIFDYGQHVGIYMGNERMIDAGGGAGQVSYMGLGPGYYWGKHITAVKRMF